MKKTAILTMIFSILIVTSCLNSFAQDLTGQITALEQKADRIQNQISQAKQQAQTGLDQQVRAVQATIDSLVNQRVQLDAHIGKLESQMDDMKKSAQSNLEKQVQQYKVDLASVKQQISGMVAQRRGIAETDGASAYRGRGSRAATVTVVSANDPSPSRGPG